MQSDLESGMPETSEKTPYEETMQEKNEMAYSKQKEFVSAQKKLRGTHRPSETAWHLILVSGDVLLFIALFGLLFLFHMLPEMSTSTFGKREAELMWACLALVSWGLAVNMTQSQHLNYASNRFKGPCCTFFALVLTCLFWTVLSYVLLGLNIMVSARLELFFLGLAIPLFSIWRFLFAEIKHLERFHQRAVIVGVNPAGETVAEEIKMSRSSSTSILGYIGENTEERTSHKGLPILGDRDTLHYLVYHNMIDMIIVALEYGANPGLFKEATDAAQFGISVVPMEVVYESCAGKIPVEHVGDQWYVALQSEHIISPLYLFWKKGLDLLCGILGLLLLCLVTPILALCIYLDSPGPIFYSQERVGFRGKPFRIYKFRSMRIDAEGKGQAIWASKTDQRVTRVGRFMRATHLDELPQLFNILRGEMSMIGPRPERATFIKELEKTVPFYGHRLAVKPGLTGWAQVKYRYGSSDNDALIKLQYDLYYIKRQSFMLDLFIVLNTVVEVLYRRGV
jgi:exopolysaccharide biosynthesis polyprenyl glycosylphosphotransferase